MKVRFCTGVSVLTLCAAMSVKAQDNLQALLGEAIPPAPAASAPAKSFTTSPDTLALLDKLLLEESDIATTAARKPMTLPSAVRPPADFFSPDAEAMCDTTATTTLRNFNQALSLAICQDPQMRILALNLKRYLLDYKISQSAWMPEINMLFNTGSETSQYDLAGRDNYRTNDRTTNTGVELSWLLFDFGKREAAIGEKKNIWLSNQYQTLSKFQDYIIGFAQTYYQVIAKKTIMIAAKDNEKVARKTWEITQNKYRSGVGVLGDALQAENMLLSATQNRMQKEGEYEVALGKLASALNLPLSSRLQPDDLFTLPGSSQMMALQPLLDEASARHPLVLAAQKNIEAAEQQVNQAQRDFLPSVTLRAGANKGHSSVDEAQYVPVNRTDTMYVGLNVSVPLFSGFRRYNQLQAAHVQLAWSQQDYQNTLKDIGLNTWNAWQGLNTVNRSLEVIAQRLKTARRAYEIANGRYLTGVGTIIELLNTQQQLSNAEIDEANIKMDWYLQRLSLLASVGKLSLM